MKGYKLVGVQTGRLTGGQNIQSIPKPMRIELTATIHIREAELGKEIVLNDSEQAMLRNAKFIRIQHYDVSPLFQPNTTLIFHKQTGSVGKSLHPTKKGKKK